MNLMKKLKTKLNITHMNQIRFFLLLFLIVSNMFSISFGQNKITDSNTPLHRLEPDYDTPYGPMERDSVIYFLDQILNYLDETTPVKLINRNTGAEIRNYKKPIPEATIAPGDFRIISYEWGVTYAGMLNAYEATGNMSYLNYVHSRMKFISDLVPYFKEYEKLYPDKHHSLWSVFHPRALDDAGAMCAAMIKTDRMNESNKSELLPLMQNYIDWISNHQYRLSDGTLARNRPQTNTLWLDDLFMSVPALAQMGKLTGETKYFDDAARQVLKFSERMFDWQKGLFIHGWVESMEYHPEFHWARANGWALMAIVELLTVLPEDHSARESIMKIMKTHVNGLMRCQSGKGFWHQLLDKQDSYLETSATAIYTYSIAKGINEGWLDPVTYGPMVLLAWNAVSTKINENGQVEGTCVGTGMGFDPAFYYYRPVNEYAAHGYGPTLLAGSEILKLLNNQEIKFNDSSVQFYK